MKLRLFEMRGDYNICVRREGQVCQSVDIHNLFTQGFISRLTTDDSYFNYCQLGSGSNIPSSSDTRLSHRLWAVRNSSYELSETSADGLSRTWTYTYVFPASSSYVGVIREVGLCSDGSNYDGLNTHALVVDAEGNPISINKTYLDEVIITAKITITRPKWTTGQTWAFDSGPLYRTYLRGLLLRTNGQYGKHIVLSAQWCPEYHTIKNCLYTTLLTSFTYANGTIYCSAEFSGNAMTYPYDNSSGAPFVDYVNSLLLGRSTLFPTLPGADYYTTPPFRLLMPNNDLFPITTLQTLSLGTGDGVTTDFTPELPAWLENTELVYNNGVLLTRNVDYQVDHLHNLQKMQSVMLGNFVAEIDAEKIYNVQGFIWGAYECTASTNNDYDVNSPVVRTNSPIVYKYGTDYAFTTKVNYFRLGTWTASGSIPAGASLVFYYSRDNGSSWIEFGRITRNSAGTAFTDTTEHTMPEVSGITHVKITLEDTTTTEYVRHSSHNSRFGYVGSYAIRFLTAPAVGDELTMDVQIDRPWKSADNVIQWNPVLTFGV